jgi:hypothetical protein
VVGVGRVVGIVVAASRRWNLLLKKKMSWRRRRSLHQRRACLHWEWRCMTFVLVVVGVVEGGRDRSGSIKVVALQSEEVEEEEEEENSSPKKGLFALGEKVHDFCSGGGRSGRG